MKTRDFGKMAPYKRESRPLWIAVDYGGDALGTPARTKAAAKQHAIIDTQRKWCELIEEYDVHLVKFSPVVS